MFSDRRFTGTRTWLLAACSALLTLLTLLTPPAAAEPNQPGWFVGDVWSQKNGLLHNFVNAVVRTRDGYLWVGSAGGLSRFDGARFTVFDDSSAQPLGDNDARALVEGSDGSLWIGTTAGGVSRWRDGRLYTYTTRDGSRDGPIDNFVTSLAADPAGRIWIGTEGGLSVFEDGRFRHLTTADGLPQNAIKSLHADRSGDVWIGTRNGGLSRLRAGRIERVAVQGLSPTRGIMSIRGDGERGLWLATYEGLFLLKGGNTRRFTSADGLSSERLVSLHEDPEGHLWVGAVDGLHRIRDGRIEQPAGAVPTGAGTIANDGEGGLWIATGGTLTSLRQGHFVGYTTANGLSYYYVTTIYEDRHGSVWMATGKGLNRLAGGQVTSFWAEQGLPPALIGALSEDREGHLWVGTDAGLYRSQAPLAVGDAGAPVRFIRVPNQPQPNVQARGILLGADGTLWIGASMGGLVRHRGGVFTVFTTRDGLLHDDVRGVAEDRQGHLWVGTRGGLNRFQDGKFLSYTEKDGLAHAAVERIHLDRDGVLWAATRRGVNRLDNGHLTTITARDGLSASYVNALVDDDQGNLWMGCSKGVFRVRRQQLADFAAGKLAAVESTAYGSEHGLTGTIFSGGYDGAIRRTRDGRVWFAMTRGVSVIDPARLKGKAPPPPVHIEEVTVDGRALVPGPRLEAPPGRGELSIRYTGLGFLAPSKVRFRYQLVGHDRGWVDAQDRRIVQYSNIPPGSYTFRVIAANGDGVWNQAGAALTLILLPRWFQRPSFRAAGFALLLLLASGVHRMRVRQLARAQRKLEHKVAERTAALATINKELEAFSYSASHDLRAPLRTIQGFSRALMNSHASRLDEEGRDLLARVQDGSLRMQRLIDDLLALARVGRSDLRRAPVDLGELARIIVGELREREPERQIELRVAPGLTANADPDLTRIGPAEPPGECLEVHGQAAAGPYRAGDGRRR